MKDVFIVLREQFTNLGMIVRVSRYDDKATYQSHYLGLIWQILNPIIQVGVYYLIFGMGLYGGREVEGVPFIAWMMLGLTCWFYMSATMLGTSQSIYRQLYLVSKMNFPVSTLPSVNIVSNLTSFWAMLAVTMLTIFSLGLPVSVRWFQVIYFFFCMIVFMFALGIFSATMTVLIRDYHMVLQSVIRLLLYLSGAVWNIRTTALPPKVNAILQLDPVFYVIDGFRKSLFNGSWFWQHPVDMAIFWLITLLLLFIGCHLHIKFRARFVDLA
ncbi:ABC transporter permease [Lacticaseibacillus yichunensis]|uniref:Transport permease protein n=1 Tax=Lacticaseibacillus yichunensis TaxID=2486015 RepID=A0ABW4CSS7_9LACO|nr:ABC transporter permease [Lacticaseibacillus yichunensis]